MVKCQLSKSFTLVTKSKQTLIRFELPELKKIQQSYVWLYMLGLKLYSNYDSLSSNVNVVFFK